MTDVATKAREAGGDAEFSSHMEGIARRFGLNWNSTVDHRLLPQVVAAYEEYTGKRYGGENLHSGDTIVFSQFLKSALQHY